MKHTVSIIRTTAALLALCAALTAQEQEPKPRTCSMSLANGDHLEATMVRIAEGRIVFRPMVAPDTQMELPLSNVSVVRFNDVQEQAMTTGAEVMRLHDGSYLAGKLIRLGSERVEFDFEDAGKVTVPRAELAELDHELGKSCPTPLKDSAVLVTAKDDMLLGSVSQDDDGAFVVEGGAVRARLSWENVQALRFANPEPAPSVEDPGAKPKKVLLCALSSLRGSHVVGTDPELVDGRFSLTLAGGQRVTLSDEGVAEMVFSDTGGLLTTRRILVWGKYSDRGDEYRKTMDIVKARLGDQWEIIEKSDALDDDFRTDLRGVSVLLMPEMEQGTPGGDEADKLKPMAEEFLRRGGKIVILGPTNNHIAFLKQAGLVDIQAPTNRDGARVSFAGEGKRLFADVGESFTTTNSTYFYVIREGIQAMPLAGENAAAPIVGRRVGRGWVIVMGMDYYAHNEGTAKILANALMLR